MTTLDEMLLDDEIDCIPNNVKDYSSKRVSVDINYCNILRFSSNDSN
jgi:hypothetical protein